jgi:hypothetical protein
MLKPIVALRYGQIMAEADFRSGKTLTETAWDAVLLWN